MTELCLCVAPGYRSVPLKNSYNEDLELASLLVHIDIIRGRVSYCLVLLLNMIYCIYSVIKTQNSLRPIL